MYPTGVKVVAGLEEVQDLPIQDILPSMEWRPQVVIAAACIADPYLLLHFSDGSAVLLSGDEEEGKLPSERSCPADVLPFCDFHQKFCSMLSQDTAQFVN